MMNMFNSYHVDALTKLICKKTTQIRCINNIVRPMQFCKNFNLSLSVLNYFQSFYCRARISSAGLEEVDLFPILWKKIENK